MASKFVVRKSMVMSRREKFVFGLLVTVGLVAIVNYAVWWVQPGHVPAGLVGHILYFALSLSIWTATLQQASYWFLISKMRRPVWAAPKSGQRVAMLTCFVPGKEPYDMLERTLAAMVRVRYPHDTWVLDEGDDTTVKEMCIRLGVNHFSRKDIDKYNQPSGPFKSCTKAGNHNAWRDAHESKYDLVAQMDMDHTPKPNYLERTLGYFADPKVGFVVAPQIYGNQDNWIARGAAEQCHCFHGPIQQGLFGIGMPLFIGTNHVYRATAMRSVGGYASIIVEDHLTGMRMVADGWKGVYVPEIIAIGEGPANWTEYLNQQTRWSYGIFEILFKYTPKLLHKLSWRKRLGYLSLQTYYFTGAAMIISVALTSIALLLGASVANMNLVAWALHAVPPIIVTLTMYYWTQRFYLDPKNEQGTLLRGMFMTIGALPIYARALGLILLGRKVSYAITAKGTDVAKDKLGIFGYHLGLASLSVVSLTVGAVLRPGYTLLIGFWAFFNVATMGGAIVSAIVLNRRTN